jgi:hypothetical protein
VQSGPVFTKAELAYVEKLRKEEPKIFTGCPGQGDEQSPRDLMPNLRVVGMVYFVTPASSNDFGIIKKEYAAGTKIVYKHLPDVQNVKITWSTSDTNIELYSLVTEEFSFNTWTQSKQAVRGNINETNFHTSNDMSYTRLYILGYDPKDPCSRNTSAYSDISWPMLLKSGQL